MDLNAPDANGLIQLKCKRFEAIEDNAWVDENASMG
jgi:hypothetical protein